MKMLLLYRLLLVECLGSLNRTSESGWTTRSSHVGGCDRLYEKGSRWFISAFSDLLEDIYTPTQGRRDHVIPVTLRVCSEGLTNLSRDWL